MTNQCYRCWERSRGASTGAPSPAWESRKDETSGTVSSRSPAETPVGRVGSWFFSQGLWQPQAQLPSSKYGAVLNQPDCNWASIKSRELFPHSMPTADHSPRGCLASDSIDNVETSVPGVHTRHWDTFVFPSSLVTIPRFCVVPGSWYLNRAPLLYATVPLFGGKINTGEQLLVWSGIQGFLGLTHCLMKRDKVGARTRASHLPHVKQQKQELDPGLLTSIWWHFPFPNRAQWGAF